MSMIAVETISAAIAAAITAGCAPGTIPSHELMLKCFTDVYEQFSDLPSEDQHRQISERVGALIANRR